jgi:hypothetical protein
MPTQVNRRTALLLLAQKGVYRLEAQAFFLFCSLAIAWLADDKQARAR